MPGINKSLLRKYLDNSCTPEEERLIHRWFDLNDADSYPEALDEQEYDHKEKRIWNRLAGSLEGLQTLPSSGEKVWKRISYRALFRYAAVILFLLTAAWILNEYTQGGLWWNGTIYKTKYGETKDISLSDGSVVTLNSMSILKVPRDYGRADRNLYLEGEAYFIVKKDSLHAFTVYSNDISTTALGTMFNVSAYADDEKTIVSLREGKVAVKKVAFVGSDNREEAGIILRPGEEAIYSLAGPLIKNEFNRKERLGWREQILYFKDAGLEEVVHKLERHYGVEFNYAGLEEVHWKLTGEYRHLSLTEVLESLSFNYGIQYRIHGKQVTLQR